MNLEGFKVIVDALDNPIYVCNPDDVLVYLNKAANSLWANAVGEICYKRFYYKEKPCIYCPRRDRKGDGNAVLPPLNRIFRIKADKIDDELTCFIMYEETGLKQFEGRVDELKWVLSSISDLVILMDMNGKIYLSNKSADDALSHFGELKGTSILEYLDPGEHARLSSTIRRLFASKIILFETLLYSKDGTSIPVEINMQIADLNEQKMVLLVGRDIKERMMIEQNLKESETLFREFFYSSPIALIAFDEQGNVVNFNKAAEDLYGFKSNEVIDKRLIDTIYRYSANADGLITEVFSGIQVIGRELNCLDKLGRQKSILVYEFPIRDEEGRIFLALSAQVDITERKELESELSLLKQAVQASSDGIIISDLNTKMIYINPAIEKVLGYTKEDIIGKTLEIIIPQSLNEEGFESIIDKLKNKGTVSVELKSIKKDKSTISVQFNAGVITDAYGVPKGIVTLLHDISLEKETAARIEALSNLNQEIIDNLDAGIHLVDRNGEILLSNRRLNELSNLLLDEELVKQDDIISLSKPALDEIEHVLNQHEPLVKDWTHDKKEGKVYFETKRSPLLDTSGKIGRILTVIRDTTSQKRGQRLRSMLKVVLDNAAESLLIIDAQGRLIYSNAAMNNRHGLEADLPLNIDLESLFASWEKIRLKKILDDVNKLGIWTGEIFEISQSGETFSTLTSLIRLGTEKHIDGLAMLSIDLTETKKLEHELQKRLIKVREQQRQDRSYLLSISHGLHTNMSNLLGFTSLLDGRRVQDEKISEYMDYIRHSTKRLMTLVKDLVGFTRIESNLTKGSTEEIKILDTFSNCLEYFKDEIKSAKINFVLDKQDDIVLISNKEQIELVFENLIEAIIDLAKGEDIRIELTSLGKVSKELGFHIALKFTPMKPVFEPLMKSIMGERSRIFPTNLTDSRSWTNIYLIQTILETLEGRIHFKKVGDTVSLVMRLVNEPFKTLQEEGILDKEDKRFTILIVEDTPEHQMMIADQFSDEYRVIAVETGAKAIEVFRSIKPELLLIDVFLPDMNGFAVAEKIRAMDTSKREATDKAVFIIGMSAYSFTQDELTLIRASFDGFCQKPITGDVFKELISKSRLKAGA